MRKPKVSIIVPVYNAANYIEKCIDSILGQTIKDIEVILINDGSSDSSGEIINKYKIKDSRIKVISQENSGPSVARNNGIMAATGKYVGFVDSDDYIECTMYEKLYTIAEENNVQIAMCNYREVHCFDNTEILSNHNLKANKVYDKGEIEESIVRTFSKSENYGFYSLWNKVYNREWLLSTNILMDIEREHGEDWWFNIQLFMKVKFFICIDDPLYNYIHINKNSLIGKYRENQFELCLDGRSKLISTIPSNLIDYNELNTRLLYELHGFLSRSMKELEDKKTCRDIYKKYIKNKDISTYFSNLRNIPIYIKIISVLIEKGLYNTVFFIYKVNSFIS